MRPLLLALALLACNTDANRATPAPTSPAETPKQQAASTSAQAEPESCNWDGPEFDADAPPEPPPPVEALENPGRKPRRTYRYPSRKGHWFDVEAHKTARESFGVHSEWGPGWVTMPETVQLWSIDLGDANAKGARLVTVTPGTPRFLREGSLPPDSNLPPNEKLLAPGDLHTMAEVASFAGQQLPFALVPRGRMLPANQDSLKFVDVCFLFPRLPAEPIGAGAVWTIKREMTGSSPFTALYRYELLTVEGTRLRIRFDAQTDMGPARQRVDGDPAEMRMTSHIAGEAVVDFGGTEWSGHWTNTLTVERKVCKAKVLERDKPVSESHYTITAARSAKP